MNIQENYGAPTPGLQLMQGKIRDAIMQKLKPKEREVTERIKTALKGQPIEDVLRRFAGSGAKDITEEDLIIGVSKLNANLYLGDLKEFINALKGMARGEVGVPTGENKISLQDTLQLIGGQ